MNKRAAWIRTSLALVLLTGLSGCMTPYRSGVDGGVYFERPTRTVSVAYVDPLVYPYWSLDYFYYSRYYHPFSVRVHRYDPWYYPYPGWYYGHRPGPGYAGYRRGYYFPWSRHTSRYASYRPWQTGPSLSFSYYYGFGYEHGDRRHDVRDRVRDIDSRLSLLQTRRSLAIRSQRPDRDLVPSVLPALPATDRRSGDDGSVSSRSLPSRGSAVGPSGLGRRSALLDRLRDLDRSSRVYDRGVPTRTTGGSPSRAPVERQRRSEAPARPVQRPPRPVSRPVSPPRERSSSRRRPPEPRSSRSGSRPQRKSPPRSRRIDRRDRD